MRSFISSLVVVLAMANAATAAYHVDLANGSIDVSSSTSLGNGLYSFTITMNGYSAYSELRVLDPVHQCEGSGIGINPTLFDDQIAAYDPAACVFDTHVILPDSYLKIDGTGATDVITDPGVPGVDNSGFTNFTQTGMGTFTMGTGAITYSGTAPESIAIAQVVLLNASRLYGVVTTADGVKNTIVDRDGTAGVPLFDPEPGTIVMLLTGVLCLAGYRRRK